MRRWLLLSCLALAGCAGPPPTPLESQTEESIAVIVHGLHRCMANEEKSVTRTDYCHSIADAVGNLLRSGAGLPEAATIQARK